MQKIIPHLWYDREAKEAAEFYVKAFTEVFGGTNSRIKSASQLHGTPSGDVDVLSFELLGYEFASISAGPLFKFNPSVSFMVNVDPSRQERAREKVDALWERLSQGGEALMPLDKYPFSERYGWTKDKYGLSWQIILTDPKGEPRPPIIPSLLFVTEGCDKAEEATNFYLSVFKDAKRGVLARYPAGMEPNKEGAIMFTDLMLEGQWFAAMDGSARMHRFTFNEAVSFMVMCQDQGEIDRYWNALTAVPEAEQCGWLKDKYGLSWQIVPRDMNEMMAKGSKEQVARVTAAFLTMKKFDLAALKKAYGG
jgi:predicted 3-demethylubiquinone-9 3-methyltransferase (glyoxalase superfamily)